MHRNIRRFGGKFAIPVVLLALAVVGCSVSPDPNNSTGAVDQNGDFGDLGGCTPVIAAVSSEKVNLFTELAEMFKESPQGKALTTCAVILPVDVASGEAARLLKLNWPESETDKPQPVIWSPASTSWVAQVADQNGEAYVPDPQSFAHTPVVIAMPEQMARQLGWPNTPIGLSDLRDLCLDPLGWGKYGGATALWGDFKLGKTNPNTSTTGLNILLMQSYAASGKTSGLTVDDVTASTDFSKDLESCVIHYGNTTGNVLQRLYDRDLSGQPLNYVSAISLEETSLINYNIGNPTSKVVAPDEVLTPPAQKLVGIYPEEGSLESDNPIVVLGKPATWVTDEQRVAAEAFREFVQTPEAQKILGDFGFRPIDPTIPIGGLITAANGADPTKPTTLLEKPSVEVVTAATKQWEAIRKPSSVLELIDVSGSMGDSAGNGQSKMEAAIASAQSTLGHFRSTDELGVWAFTTGVHSDAGENVVEIRPVTALAGDKENLSSELQQLTPVDGTPLYDAILVAYRSMQEKAEPGRINAIVVLSDGEDTDSSITLDELLRELKKTTDGNDPSPVRIFPIVYGEGASSDALQKIAEATGGQVFNASDPRRINLVFAAVVNNF